MFGFFKKKKADNRLLNDEQEQILNQMIFMNHFSKIFDNESFDSANIPLPEKIWIFATALAQTVFNAATKSDKKICEYNSPEKTALRRREWVVV